MKFFKDIVKSNYFLLKIYFLGLAVKELINQKKILEYILHNNKEIIIYCESYSHYDTVKKLLFLIDKSNYKTCLITRFELTFQEQEKYNNIKIITNISQKPIMLFKSKLLVTPVVGFQNIFKPRKSDIFNLLVSLTSLDGVYRKDHFNDCKYIFCAGDHQVNDFYRWKKTNQKLMNKILIKGGYPKLDLQLASIENIQLNNNSISTVVYAPTHIYDVNKKLASLRDYGEAIVQKLLDLNLKVIFRPHPVSFNDEDKDLVKRIINRHSSNSMFQIDNSKNYMETYEETDFMVTDLSGTGFTYAFTFEKPVIFFAHNQEEEKNLIGIQYNNREDIGYVSRDINNLEISTVELLENLDLKKKSIISYRDSLVYNIGNSSQVCFESIEKILNDEKDDNWIKL